ncbi:hypothetical protein BJ165DRAFT_1345234 [Panaeolus papilionaceus]|nr:hypothetical protein BJ165DRAFT_1345234 [Panaeolus papilionaceus]
MSIDLEWAKLDASLASYVVDILNRQLGNAERPSFIGPVEVTSLDFGSAPPDVELVDLRDIYRDFLEDEEDDIDRGPVKVTEGGEDDDGFEWVSRRAAGREEGLAYQQLPPHMRYGRSGPADMFSSIPMMRSPVPQADPPPPANQNPHPNLQLHLHINWQSNLRITITTSLLINYPSPMFMSLPIKLSVTGLVFNGELAVAYEGERKRVHLCILDDQDPYGPAGSANIGDLDFDISPSNGTPSKSQKSLPVGQRLLPSIFIESEIGQADKHVLKNVTRVERFIQDVIRKTVEEELVFPNFHTLVMGDPNAQ